MGYFLCTRLAPGMNFLCIVHTREWRLPLFMRGFYKFRLKCYKLQIAYQLQSHSGTVASCDTMNSKSISVRPTNLFNIRRSVR